MNIPVDKQWHIGIGIILGLTAFAIAGYAFLLVMIIGMGKEVIWDKLLGKGTFEIADAAATVVPGILIAALIIWGM